MIFLCGQADVSLKSRQVSFLNCRNWQIGWKYDWFFDLPNEWEFPLVYNFKIEQFCFKVHKCAELFSSTCLPSCNAMGRSFWSKSSLPAYTCATTKHMMMLMLKFATPSINFVPSNQQWYCKGLKGKTRLMDRVQAGFFVQSENLNYSKITLDDRTRRTPLISQSLILTLNANQQTTFRF